MGMPPLVCCEEIEQDGQLTRMTYVPTVEGAWAWLRVLRTGRRGTDAEMRDWAREERQASERRRTSWPKPRPV